MREPVQIRTECYSGYMDDQTPKCFMWKGVKHQIRNVLDRWYRWDAEQKNPVKDYFMIETAEGDQYILMHELIRRKWFICWMGKECDEE